MNNDSKFWRGVAVINTIFFALLLVSGLLLALSASGFTLPSSDTEARVREKISIDARDDVLMYNGADLYVYSDDHSTRKFFVDGATGNLTTSGTINAITATTSISTPGSIAAAGTITSALGVSAPYITASTNISTAALGIGLQTFTGTVHFGTATTVISGTAISHGYSSAPTAFVLLPGDAQTSTYTQTLYAHACGATTCAVGVSQGAVVTFTTVYWFAGK